MPPSGPTTAAIFSGGVRKRISCSCHDMQRGGGGEFRALENSEVENRGGARKLVEAEMGYP